MEVVRVLVGCVCASAVWPGVSPLVHVAKGCWDFNFLPNGFSIQPLKVKLSAGEQKATERIWTHLSCSMYPATPSHSRWVMKFAAWGGLMDKAKSQKLFVGAPFFPGHDALQFEALIVDVAVSEGQHAS